jgi:hypothetical protein
MPPKRAGAPKAKKGLFKAYTPFTPDEIEQIDDWRFANRIPDRADAVRALVSKALKSEPMRRSA